MGFLIRLLRYNVSSVPGALAPEQYRRGVAKVALTEAIHPKLPLTSLERFLKLSGRHTHPE